MSLLMRRLIIIILGILAGIAAWPVAELILIYQADFPSYFVFITVLGAVFGMIMGLFFGSGEGITSSVKSRVKRGMLTGTLIGFLGGIIGFLAGQAALLLIGGYLMRSYKSFNSIGLPVSRAIGWAFLGVFIGMVEGFRAGSLKKIIIGIIGGLLGGLLGGLALEYSKYLFPQVVYSRLVGLIILGFLLGLFYGIIEKGLSFGVLRVLNGKLRGKEFLINQNRIRIGRSDKNDITLAQYENISDSHAVVKIKRGEAILANLDPKIPVFVNERAVKEHKLKMEDVIKIGSAKLYYKYE